MTAAGFPRSEDGVLRGVNEAGEPVEMAMRDVRYIVLRDPAGTIVT
jgi:hypothetical protein